MSGQRETGMNEKPKEISSVKERKDKVWEKLNEANVGDEIMNGLEWLLTGPIKLGIALYNYVYKDAPIDEVEREIPMLDESVASLRRDVTKEGQKGDIPAARGMLSYEPDDEQRSPHGGIPYSGENPDGGKEIDMRNDRSFLADPVSVGAGEKESPAVDLIWVNGEPNMGGSGKDGDPVLGKQITTIQNALEEKGYTLDKYGADGWYGEETAKAVMKFQTENGLNPSGVVDKQTREALLNG